MNEYFLPEIRKERVYSSLNVAERIGWGLHMHGIMDLKKKHTGEGVNVYVVDTGGLAHKDIVYSGGYNAVTGRDFDYQDELLHGTHCSGIIGAKDNDIGIIGVAEGVNLWNVSVFNSSRANGQHYMNGFRWIYNHNVPGRKIVNLSLGSPTRWIVEEEMIKKMVASGIVVISAAGNDGTKASDVLFPARYDSTISVASHNINKEISSFSTRGKGVDIAAPGEGILSTVGDNGYEAWSGTSMACPFVVGVAAMMLEKNPNLSPEEVKKIIIETATDAGKEGKDVEFGYGIINPTACLNYEDYSIEKDSKNVEIARRWHIKEQSLKTKYVSELRTMAEDIGVNKEGLKKEIIERISSKLFDL